MMRVGFLRKVAERVRYRGLDLRIRGWLVRSNNKKGSGRVRVEGFPVVVYGLGFRV